MDARPALPARQLARIRETRRHPKRTQPDWAPLTVLAAELQAKLAQLERPLGDVLDLFAATQPYRDLLTDPRSYVAMDIDEHYGPQDVVSQEFLPFADGSFDLIISTESFHYIVETEAAIAELKRVLRPGGTLLLTMPLVWEYDRRTVERRYTGPELAALFEGWEQVEARELGGYAVAWAMVTGRVLRGFTEFGPRWSRSLASALLPAACFVLNGIAALLARAEPRWHTGPFTLPAGLMLTARRPVEA